MPALDRLPPANAHIRPHPPFDDNPPMSGRPQSAKIILRDQPQTRVRQAARNPSFLGRTISQSVVVSRPLPSGAFEVARKTSNLINDL